MVILILLQGFDMAHLVKSKTDENDKNYWATSNLCLLDAVYLYGKPFKLDVAAEPLTAKCKKYYSPSHLLDALINNPVKTKLDLLNAEKRGNFCVGLDALNIDWMDDWWCNPPFDLKSEFIAKAKQQQREGFSGMMLLPYERQTQWWRNNLSDGVVIYEQMVDTISWSEMV